MCNLMFWSATVLCEECNMFRYILVLMESLAGSGHKFAAKRLRLGDKLELLRLDPWGMSSAMFTFFLFSV